MPFNAAEFAGISTFLKNHERLILGLVLVGAGFFGYTKWVNFQEGVAQRKADATQAALNAQVQANTALAAASKQAADQSAAAIAQYQQMVTALTAQNQQLANQIAQRNQGLEVQKGKNASLDAAGVASRIDVLENLPLGSVAPLGDGVSLNHDAAHQVLDDLESVPVLNQNLKDETQTVANKDTQIKGLQDIVAKQQTQIDDLTKQLAGAALALKDSEANTVKQVDLQKQKDRKSKIAWFKGGVVVGFVAGLFVGHTAHI
jgi:hypothetical protein